ncbi:SurA N-terminal domain-containing protein [Salinicoccus bachuensis]|uniref:peptidylprolyl isomerase n=1 Tax=Salinicoccus bachuensis TaxID=3136731 RepID=A0ABZ3CIZ6_9STAP
MKKLLFSLSLGTSIAVLAACGGGDESAENTNEEPETQEEAASGNSDEAASESNGEAAGEEESAGHPEMPEPDLEDVPDVVAEVNGEEITKEEFEQVYTAQFQQAAMQQQMAGEEVDQDQLKEQVVEGMVSQKLLIQEAGNSDISVPEEEVNETIDQLVEQNGLESQDEFFAALEEQGMSEEEVRSQLETELKANKLIAEEAGDIEPTEEELQTMYDEMTSMQEESGEGEVPSFEEVKPQLEDQVKMTKEGEAAQGLVEELREDADVTIHL